LKKGRRYKVQRTGQTVENAQWEPASKLTKYKELIDAFDNVYGMAQNRLDTTQCI